MKIISINSSPKKNGNTAILLREVLKGAHSAGATTEELFLTDYVIRFCKGCFNCVANGGCVIKDDFEVLKSKMVDTDGIVLGSPNYAFSLNAQMKQFLEQFGLFEYMTSSVFGGKYFVTVATTGGTGAKRVADYLAHLATGSIFKRAFLSGVVMSRTGKLQVAQNTKALQQAYSTGQKLAADITGNNFYPFQNLFGRIINALLIKPQFLRIIKVAKDGRMKAVYEHLMANSTL